MKSLPQAGTSRRQSVLKNAKQKTRRGVLVPEVYPP